MGEISNQINNKTDTQENEFRYREMVEGPTSADEVPFCGIVRRYDGSEFRTAQPLQPGAHLAKGHHRVPAVAADHMLPLPWQAGLPLPHPHALPGAVCQFSGI